MSTDAAVTVCRGWASGGVHDFADVRMFDRLFATALIERHEADERPYVPRGRLRDVGIWTHYFAATPQELEAMDLDDGPGGGDWPYVDCKGWMLEVEEFAGEIDGRDESEFGRDEPINFDPADQEYEGPWTLRINAELVATLARLDSERIRAYADRYLLEDWEVERLLNLADLARSASAEGRQLYVWSSL
jgi:hypothetical protein